MTATLAAAALAGLVVAALAGWELLLVGLAAVLATLGYSGGPRPYASAGLGEVFVFVFFGLVATVGSAYVQDERLTWVPVVAALPMGLFAVAMLVVNNLRDIPSDREVGKATLAVRLGDRGTRRLFVGLVVAAFVVVVALLVALGNGWLGLPLLAVVVVAPAVQLVRHAPRGPRLVQALALTGRGQLLVGVLLALGLLLDGWTGS
jgi:1,4-dihydroxy-2-naphthoate octaprenyltransferase